MAIYKCRVDDKYFNSEQECHNHVDRQHSDWGHSVCQFVSAFKCTICGTAFESKETCGQHLADEHAKTGDLSGDWEAVLGE